MMNARVQFVRLGTGRERELKGGHSVYLGETASEAGPEVAAIVSAAARKLVPSLKDVRLAVRLTTPDGGPWTVGYAYLDNADTGRRVGHGLVELYHRDAEGGDGGPVQLHPYSTTERHDR